LVRRSIHKVSEMNLMGMHGFLPEGLHGLYPDRGCLRTYEQNAPF
jgi:hypothetical protein